MAGSTSAKASRPRPRKARGQDRPNYLDSPDLDRVFIMMTSLVAEVSALRDRVDTHEALAERGEAPSEAAVEAYVLDPARQAGREMRRDAMIGRVLRVLYEERDGNDAATPAV